jgi:hypothetical protein
MQIPTETDKESFFRVSVSRLLTLSVSCFEDEGMLMVMSGLLKPTWSLTKQLSETQFTVHKRLPKTRQCSYSIVSKPEHRF